MSLWPVYDISDYKRRPKNGLNKEWREEKTDFKNNHLVNFLYKWWNYMLFHAAAAAAKLLQSCPTLWPHRRQPNRLPHPWYSPGKNTGVGCHFLLQSIKVKSESEVAQSCPTLHNPWIAAYQAPPSMRFSRKEYWSGVSLPSPIWQREPQHCKAIILQLKKIYIERQAGGGYRREQPVWGISVEKKGPSSLETAVIAEAISDSVKA